MIRIEPWVAKGILRQPFLVCCYSGPKSRTSFQYGPQVNLGPSWCGVWGPCKNSILKNLHALSGEEFFSLQGTFTSISEITRVLVLDRKLYKDSKVVLDPTQHLQHHVL